MLSKSQVQVISLFFYKSDFEATLSFLCYIVYRRLFFTQVAITILNLGSYLIAVIKFLKLSLSWLNEYSNLYSMLQAV